MKAHLRYLRDIVRNSYWFTPGLITLGVIALAAFMVRLDRRYVIEGLSGEGWVHTWVYTGGPDGAREVLSTIAGSMMTVAGVVFSITIVALTLASSQFGPRVLSNFMRDRGNQLVLGTFIGTFVYSLLVLRSIRSGDGPGPEIVPHFSVTVAIILALASLAVLIYFIHHVSISIQAPHLVASIGAELEHGIADLFSRVGAEREAGDADESDAGRPSLPESFDEDSAPVTAPYTGYLEAMDLEQLIKVARDRDVVMRLELRPGHFVVRGSTLARVWPPDRMDGRMAKKITGSIVTGARRTPIQDVEFPVTQLVEIAVRALSPSLNDPVTASNCIDHLGAGLCHLASRGFPSRYRRDSAGELRVVIARPITFAGVVSTAFEQIRQNAGQHTAVYVRLLEAIARVIESVEGEERLRPLLRQAELVLERSSEEVSASADRDDVQRRYRALRATADRRLRALQRG